METFGLGTYRGNAFTTGCSPNAEEHDKCYKKTEIFDLSEMVWNGEIPDYPFIEDDSKEKGIYHYSTTHTPDAVFIIGGHVTRNIVAEFRDNQWKHIANLKRGRSRHGSISFGGQTIIIGGEDSSGNVEGDLPTEVWDFQTGNGRSIEPSLPAYDGYSNGIGLYFVDANFDSSCSLGTIEVGRPA